MQGKLACVIWNIKCFHPRGHKHASIDSILIGLICVYRKLQNQSSGPWNKQLIESHIVYPLDNQLKKKAKAEISLLIKTTHDNLFGLPDGNRMGGAIDIFIIIARWTVHSFNRIPRWTFIIIRAFRALKRCFVFYLSDLSIVLYLCCHKRTTGARSQG